MSFRIDAGANRPAGPQRINVNAPKAPAADTQPATQVPPKFVLADPQGSRLREIMEKAGKAKSADERSSLQGELDRLRSEMGSTGNSPDVLATLAELSVASENVSAARSRLTDVGAARTASHLAQDQIRQSAPAALRAQANAAPSSTQGLLDS